MTGGSRRRTRARPRGPPPRCEWLRPVPSPGRWPALLAAGLLSAAAPGGLAAQGCEDDETVFDCWRRHNGGEIDSRRAAAEAKQAASDSAFLRLFGKLTGLGAGEAAGLASAVSDFLPIFAVIPSIASFEESDLGVAVETNLPLYPRVGAATQPPNLRGTLKLRAELREPEPFPPLLESVGEGEREAIRSLLSEDLDPSDDLTFSAVWNAEGTRIGRSFGRHVSTFDAVLASTVDAVESELVEGRPGLTEALRPFIARLSREEEWKAIVDSTRADVCEVDFDAFEELDPYRMECFREPFRTALGQAIARHALGFAEYIDAIDTRLRDIGFRRLADLLNNQPQLSVSAELRVRDEVVGPDGYGFALRFEQGFANLNSLRSACGGSIRDAGCVRGYLSRPDVIAALDRSDRVWASVELDVIDDYTFRRAVGETMVSLDRGGSVSLRGSLGVGRQIRVDAQGGELARVDLAIEGELNEDSSGRNDRFVASLTYSQKISEALTLPLGITYANKAEFLGDVDDRLGVHLGFRWRLRRGTPALPGSS